MHLCALHHTSSESPKKQLDALRDDTIEQMMNNAAAQDLCMPVEDHPACPHWNRMLIVSVSNLASQENREGK